MRVAVFGGTGFVGCHLLDALLEAEHEPSLLVRPGSEDRVADTDKCRVTSGDLGSSAAVAATLEGCGAVIYNVGILRELPKRGITFEAMHYDGVRRVIEAARAQDVPRFVLMSANGVRADGTPYQQTKFRAEQAVRASGLDVTVFRPSVIFGDPAGRDEIASQLYRQMIAPPLPAIGFRTGFRADDRVLMSPVHVDDVAAAFVAALENPQTHGVTYELGGPEILSWEEMLRRIAAATDRRKRIIPLPIVLMKLPAALFGWLPFFPVTLDQLKMLEEGNTADPSQLRALTGREPRAFDRDSLAYLR